MAERASALDGHYHVGRFGSDGEPGVCLALVRDLQLQQVAAWSDTFTKVAISVAAGIGIPSAPEAGRSISGDNGAMLRVEPLKWWLVDAAEVTLEPDQGAVVDLSHSRTRIRVIGIHATTLLNRFLPLDLRQPSFAEGRVASSVLHHIGVTLWRSPAGYELFVPRGFALSAWEVILDSAGQFGVEVL